MQMRRTPGRKFCFFLAVLALISLITIAGFHSDYFRSALPRTGVRLEFGETDALLLNATRLALAKLDTLGAQVADIQRRQEGYEEQKQKLQELIDRADQAAVSGPGGLSPQDLTLVRQGHRGPRTLCAYSEGELEGILTLGHSCRRNEKHYFYNGVWMDWQLLSNELFSPNTRDPIACVLACTDQPPCDHVPCIRPIYMRRNSTDVLVVRQLLEWGEYDVIKPHLKLSTILDAGANVGIAATIFAFSFPHARIVCVEASRKNFDILRLNVANYPNVIPVNAALWPRVTGLSLIHGNRNPELPPEWGFMVMETFKVPKGTPVMESGLLGVSVPFLMELLGIPSFDFLKIDVEGSEKELFTPTRLHKIDWVQNSKLAAVELHPDMRPGSDVAVRTFFEGLQGWSKIKEWSGEYEVFRNENANLEGLGPTLKVVNEAG